jgi:hypothetical protein
MTTNISPDVVSAAIDRARRISSEPKFRRFPIAIDEVARSLGVARIEAREMELDGYLARTSAGDLVIRYRSDNGERRNRFTIAHEIGHILLARVQGTEINSPVGRTWERNHSEEVAANKIAAELLMPERALQDDLRGCGVTWQSVFALCGTYDVSVVAMIRRILDLHGIIAVLFKIDIPRGSPDDVSGFTCDVSRHVRASFFRPPKCEVKSILKAAEEGRRHRVKLEARGYPHEIALDGRAMTRSANPQFWAFGTKSVD